ncbi:MAG: alpha-amylase [Gammaproteobacteria bacterium]|nr:alpha-amylase [Gammaproteobacteria bacterium]
MSNMQNFKKSLLTTLLSVSVVASVATLSGCSKPTSVENQAGAVTTDYLNRDVRDDVFYFVMPDRFENGDTSNDMGSKTIEISSGGFDPTSNGHYHGGDLPGLINKLDYLKGMGITAIWLTPIMRNQAVQGDSSGYHGYWTLDFTEIDPHLGTNADLKNLIDTAHSKGIKIFFDIITNHTADVIKYEECHREATKQFSTSEQLCPYVSLADKAAGKGYTPYVNQDEKNLKTPAWLNDPKYYNNQGDSTWQGENSIYGDFMGLDDLNTKDPEVIQGFIDIYNNIIRKFKPDGFRIDTVKHVDMVFWQQFTPAIIDFANEQGIPNFFVFGEVYSEDARQLSRFTTDGKIPSVLDFHLQLAVKNVFGRGKATSELNDLFELDHLYNDEDSSADYLMNFVSNHDMGRFAYYMREAFPDASEQEQLARVKLANAFMFFARGIPVIYYGEEQGFVGEGGDKGARENMKPSKVEQYNRIDLLGTDKTTADDNFDQTHPLYIAFKEFADVYQAYPELRRGEQQVLSYGNEAGVFALSRTLDDEQSIVIFNSSTEAQSVSDIDLGGKKVVFGELNGDGNVKSIAGLSFVILK